MIDNFFNFTKLVFGGVPLELPQSGHRLMDQIHGEAKRV
jgi:hypothetical protein